MKYINANSGQKKKREVNLADILFQTFSRPALQIQRIKFEPNMHIQIFAFYIKFVHFAEWFFYMNGSPPPAMLHDWINDAGL